MTLRLERNVEIAQAVADRFLDQIIAAALNGVDGPNFDSNKARAAVAPVLEAVRGDERRACIAILEGFDRTGREWVQGSLWSNIFTEAIAAMRARGEVQP